MRVPHHAEVAPPSRPRSRRGRGGRGRPVPGAASSSASSPSSRMALSNRLISARALRPDSSTLRSASRSSAASPGIRWRTAPTCSTITLTAWATTSWSSRAMRPAFLGDRDPGRGLPLPLRAGGRAPRPPRSAPCARAGPSRPASRSRTWPAPRPGRRTSSSARCPRPPPTPTRRSASPSRERAALRWAPSSTAAPMPAIRMPAPLTTSCASMKDSALHSSHVVAGAAKGKRRRARSTSTADVMPTRPNANRGPVRVHQVVTQRRSPRR